MITFVTFVSFVTGSTEVVVVIFWSPDWVEVEELVSDEDDLTVVVLDVVTVPLASETVYVPF